MSGMSAVVAGAAAMLATMLCALLAAGAPDSTVMLSMAAVFLAIREADGRCRQRRSHAATYSRDWFDRCVPNMSEADFFRTFRVSRAVFEILVAAAVVSSFYAAPAHSGALPVTLQVAMALYKSVTRVERPQTHA